MARKRRFRYYPYPVTKSVSQIRGGIPLADITKSDGIAGPRREDSSACRSARYASGRTASWQLPGHVDRLWISEVRHRMVVSIDGQLSGCAVSEALLLANRDEVSYTRTLALGPASTANGLHYSRWTRRHGLILLLHYALTTANAEARGASTTIEEVWIHLRPRL